MDSPPQLLKIDGASRLPGDCCTGAGALLKEDFN